MALEGAISKKSAQQSLAHGNLPQVLQAQSRHAGSTGRQLSQGSMLASTSSGSAASRLPDGAPRQHAPYRSCTRFSSLAINTQRALHSQPCWGGQGDLIPWTVGQQMQDPDFPALSGVRIVRIAVHPDLPRAGYGSRAVELLRRCACTYHHLSPPFVYAAADKSAGRGCVPLAVEMHTWYAGRLESETACHL